MYAIYKELHPPTGVEHCQECHFFDLQKLSLVVASASLLRVYNLSEPIDVPKDSGLSTKRKLVQVGEYRLYGNVQSLGRVKLHNAERDSILLAFKQAKLSVVEYDPENNDLKTVSLHFFEDDEIKGGMMKNIHHPSLRVDPENRCAAMLIYGNHLAVLPFHQENLLEDSNPATAFLDDAQPMTPLMTSEDHHAIFPSYTIELQALSEKIMNVRDFHFLHGYNNPTVFILYEPTPTWAGRITLRKDTCCMAAISLNTSQKLSPVIWHCSQLPFDMCYCLPVPMPAGGVLMIGANTIIYMNQSSQTVGYSLNALTETTTNFQLREASHLAISMDCSHATFVSDDQLVVALRGGEIYILTLVPDGLRGIKTILFEKAAAGVLPSCVCCFGMSLVFLGSRLGNSLLLGYTKKVFMQGEDVEPPVKKVKVEDTLGEDPDELEVYGTTHSVGPTLVSFKFDVFDSIMNIGPIKQLSLAQPAFLSEEFVSHSEPDLEVVTCSGHGKNGALCVLQREVRPQVVTTFELPGCSDMWTVLSDTEESVSDGCHTFLILSQAESTMVLQTGQEITELDSSGFATQSSTVYASNMSDGHYIIQVTSTDVRLLKGTNLLCRVALDMGGGVRSCGITDPYVLVLLADGTVAMLQLITTDSPILTLTWPELAKGSKVNLISAYTDVSRLFQTESNRVVSEGVADTSFPGQCVASVDEEDELLYGDVNTLTKKISQESHKQQPLEKQVPPPPAKSNWCAVYREDGSLEIYQIPNFNVVFCVRNFSSNPRTLKDSGPLSSDQLHSSEASVSEILLVGLGPQKSLPHLLAVVDKDLVIYSAFPYSQQPAPGHLHLRFSKVQHKVLISDRKEVKTVKQLSQQSSDTEEQDVKSKRFVAQLREFRDIGGYSGVFVCGSYPHWLMVTQRGGLHLHPMFIDGPITSFTSFHNVNCPKGFLYFSAEGELRISVLPSYLSYDAPWPTRKVPTYCTPHFISYHMESKTHALVTSREEPVQQVPTGETTEELETIERDERFSKPMEDKFFLQLYSPVAWEPVPTTKFDLGRFERVVCMKVMKLRSQETMTGRKEFIVMGTTLVCGEDIQCNGKIQIFDVIEVIPEPGKPLTKHRLKCLYNEEQKGPISTLEAVDGLLLACMAQKIYMWHFKDNKDLVGVAFIDSETYIHKALALKNFILIADINRSVQLLRYQEHLRNLSVVSKDQFPGEIYACDYVIDGQQLGFIASDSDQNLILFQYQPELPESYGGQYLTRRGDFNAGSHINAFFRVYCKSAAPLGASSDVKALMTEKRHVTFFATLDGGIGYILPIAEKVYRRLLMLQTKLSTGIPHNAGLNPKAFRMFQTQHQYLHNCQKNILDGELLSRYPQLSLKQRKDFAKQIGTSPAQILDDLKELDKITAHF